ncbi:MAG: hypothetical protein HGA54_07045 [Actinobacteria bacterium]|nr:hypothetical protein [Actinomycetota bacterium]
MEIQWPLILFTLFICLSAGIFAAQGILAFVGKGTKLQPVALLVSFLAMVVGGIASFTHLQHWERIFNGFGHITSGITQEMIALVVMAIAMVVFFVVMWKSAGDDSDGGKIARFFKGEFAASIVIPKWTAVLAIVTAVAMVVITSHSYEMPSRLVWHTPILYFYYLAQAFVLGAAGIWVIAAATKTDDVVAPAVKYTLIAGVVMAVAVAAYAVFIASMNVPDVGYHFDPTHPMAGLVESSVLTSSIFSGSLAWVFWGGAIVLGCLIPALVAFLKKSSSEQSGLFGFVAFACALAGGIAFRYILYALGFTVFRFF